MTVIPTPRQENSQSHEEIGKGENKRDEETKRQTKIGKGKERKDQFYEFLCITITTTTTTTLLP